MTSSLSPAVADLVQQTLLGEVAEDLQVAVIAYNELGTYLAANQAACRLTGYTRAELLALPFGTLSGAQAHKLAEETTRLGQARGRGPLRRADGTTIEVEWLAVSTRVANLPAMASLFWPADSIS